MQTVNFANVLAYAKKKKKICGNFAFGNQEVSSSQEQ